MKGYDKFDPDENEGQLQSSLSEWEESIKNIKTINKNKSQARMRVLSSPQQYLFNGNN